MERCKAFLAVCVRIRYDKENICGVGVFLTSEDPGVNNMKWYMIGNTLEPLDHTPEQAGAAVVLLNSEELVHETALPGLDNVLCHTPSGRDAHVCKAETRSGCLSGTLALPLVRRDGARLRCGYLVTQERVVLVDDGEMIEPYIRHIVKEKRLMEHSVGRFLYNFFELLIGKDLHRLEEIEDHAEALEERVLAGTPDDFSAPMSALRKETMAWYRYYSQLDDVACELRENENGFFTEEECGLFHLFEERVIRLREESQLLREYCTQIQSLFQSEIDIRQNRIMQILTIVTTIFLPLSLIAGWYGMNFSGMPELHWRYGYPAIIAVSAAIVVLSLWICKKKKFW